MATDRQNGDPGPRPAGPDGRQESFPRRWLRLKREEQAREPAPSVELRAEPPTGRVTGEPEPEPSPAAEPGDADMPDLASIGEGSDLSPFFSRNVSEGLRQAALQRLFRAPKFNVRDGLDDYDDDFRSFQALGDIVTAEMRRARERAEARVRRDLAEALAEDPGARAAADGDAGGTGVAGEGLHIDDGADGGGHERG